MRTGRHHPPTIHPGRPGHGLSKPETMTIVFELGPDFSDGKIFLFSVDDLKYGFEHGMISATTAIDLAVREVREGRR